jgi:hypothetical protein
MLLEKLSPEFTAKGSYERLVLLAMVRGDGQISHPMGHTTVAMRAVFAIPRENRHETGLAQALTRLVNMGIVQREPREPRARGARTLRLLAKLTGEEAESLEAQRKVLLEVILLHRVSAAEVRSELDSGYATREMVEKLASALARERRKNATLTAENQRLREQSRLQEDTVALVARLLAETAPEAADP